MTWFLNVLFWLFIFAVLMVGSYFLFFELGTLLTDAESRARGFIRPIAVVLSLLLTPIAVAAALLLFTERRA
jgi:hypothetical protein